MRSAIPLVIALIVGAGATSDYTRTLSLSALDQAAFDAETYGEKAAMNREADGLRMTLAPAKAETGWKTPQQIRFGGDFTITATVVIKTLPKPTQEDGAAVGMAIAFQDINQPDATLLRMREPKGPDVYRFIEKSQVNPQQQMQMQMQMQMQPGVAVGGKPPKLPRPTFPASGETIRMQIQREGQIVRFQVVDVVTGQSRYLGQAQLGPNDVAAVKLFVANRNGAEAINVLWRDIVVRAERISGLGTIVRTVLGDVVYADPTSIENDVLVLGGQPKAPPQPPAKPGTPNGPGAAPAAPGQPNAAPAGPAPGGPAPPAVAPPAAAKAAVAVVRVRNAAPAARGAVVVMQAGQVPAAMADPFGPGGPGPPVPKVSGPAAAAQPPPTPPKPKAKIPLDELESIRFERTPAMSARFMGQPNVDFTMPGLSAKKEEPPKKDEATKKNEPAKKVDVAKSDATMKKGDAAKKAAVAKADGRRGRESRACQEGRGRGEEEGRAKGTRGRRRAGAAAGNHDHQDRQGRAQEERHPRHEYRAVRAQRQGDQASDDQLPDRNRAGRLAARYVGFAGLAGRDRALGSRADGRHLP